MALTLDHFTDADERALRQIVDTILRNERKTGSYTSKTDVRQTGFSLHVRFEWKSDVFTNADAAEIFDSSVSCLCLVARKLLNLPDDYRPDAEAGR